MSDISVRFQAFLFFNIYDYGTTVYNTIIWIACFSSISQSILNRFPRNFAQDIYKLCPNTSKNFAIYIKYFKS